MTFTQRQINRAYYLLKKYGQDMTLTRTVAGTYNPDTSSIAAPTITTYACKGLTQFITRTSANQFYGTSTLQASLIQKDDEMCFIAAKGLAIAPTHPTDTLTISGKLYKIMFQTPLKSGGSDVMYVCQIRK